MSETAPADAGTLLASRRTGMSFQRTRLSADRTLMSIIRTALSLISFGFTIYKAFSSLLAFESMKIGVRAPQAFGTALVALGIMMLVLGILYHVQFMTYLREEREAMMREGLIAGRSPYPVSLTLLTAITLLLIGVAAISNMLFGIPAL